LLTTFAIVLQIWPKLAYRCDRLRTRDCASAQGIGIKESNFNANSARCARKASQVPEIVADV
jgi:hypothetical protein